MVFSPFLYIGQTRDFFQLVGVLSVSHTTLQISSSGLYYLRSYSVPTRYLVICWVLIFLFFCLFRPIKISSSSIYPGSHLSFGSPFPAKLNVSSKYSVHSTYFFLFDSLPDFHLFFFKLAYCLFPLYSSFLYLGKIF